MTLAVLSALVHPPETSRRGEHTTDAPTSPEQYQCLNPDGDIPIELSQIFRHSCWAPIRRLVYLGLRRTHQDPAAVSNFAQCGAEAYVLKSKDDPPRYRVAGSTCHHRLCTPCATERSRIIAQNVIDQIGSRRVRFITLTLRHGTEPLAELLDRLYTSFKLLKRTKLWKQNVIGGVAFLEIKRTAFGEHWHPHFHILCEGNYIEKTHLQEAWLGCTGDSFCADIRLPHSNAIVAREVTKYASKPLSTTFVHDRACLDEAIVALKGRRLCCTFGTWRGTLLVKTVDEQAWENLGPLSTYITRAARGDTDARATLDQIDANRTAIVMELAPIIEPRPPPEEVTPRDRQQWLIDIQPGYPGVPF